MLLAKSTTKSMWVKLSQTLDTECLQSRFRDKENSGLSFKLERTDELSLLREVRERELAIKNLITHMWKGGVRDTRSLIFPFESFQAYRDGLKVLAMNGNHGLWSYSLACVLKNKTIAFYNPVHFQPKNFQLNCCQLTNLIELDLRCRILHI